MNMHKGAHFSALACEPYLSVEHSINRAFCQVNLQHLFQSFCHPSCSPQRTGSRLKMKPQEQPELDMVEKKDDGGQQLTA